MAGASTGLLRRIRGVVDRTRAGCIVVAAAGFAADAAANSDNAASAGPARPAYFGFSDPDLYSSIGAAVFLGIVVFATVTAILYIRERGRWLRGKAEAAAEITRLRAEADRADLLLGAEPQVVIAWAGPGSEPAMVGDAARVTGGATGRRALAFGAWMPAADAKVLEDSLANLKSRGDAFLHTLATSRGGVVEAEGRAIAGRAVLRLRDVGSERTERLKIEEQLAEARATLASAIAMLDALPHPVWLKDKQRKLVWVNAAYSQAVEAATRDAAVGKNFDIVDARQRFAVERDLDHGRVYRGRIPAVIGGRRAVLDVVESADAAGGGGVAVDMTELEMVRADLERQMQSHVGTLDQLSTGVAIFDQSQRLVFHNQAYRELWGIDANFLAGGPRDGEILEQLRSLHRLPEQADFQSWKRQLLDAYRTTDNKETWWHLPDGRTMRVVTRANPQGGVTYLFDDVSERVELESKYNELMKVRRETLDSLKEGVFVFGSDGRLKLFNRAVGKMWKLPREVLKLKPHVDEVVRLARIMAPEANFWAELTGAVAGLSDQRTMFSGRIVRRDETSLDCVASPLPDGATLVTFADVTASVRAERALTERNEALEKAGRLRDDFIQHVSFELRSPLTTVIGFAQLLDDPNVGPLNARQAEYTDHIKRSSAALLAIINDILDLQSIDMGALELSHAMVDIGDIIDTVRGGVQDRLVEAEVDLVVRVADDLAPFEADPKRLRQVLFKLVSNAIGFSTHGQSISISVDGDDDQVRIVVRDEGRGIPDDVKHRVFERFESYTRGSRHRGVGLGLPLVRAFIEAHGGAVELKSTLGQGTIVTCTLPTRIPTKRSAADGNGHQSDANPPPSPIPVSGQPPATG